MRRLPRQSRGRDQRGFTLIEAMIAALVFVVGALGLLGLMYRSTAGLATANNITAATLLARAKLEELVARPYDHADLTTGAHVEGAKNLGPSGTPHTPATFSSPTGGATGDFGAADGWFARSWTVTEVVANSFKNIVVTVSWYDKTAKKDVVSDELLKRSVTLAGGKSIQ